MTTSSPGPGTVSVLQLLATSQEPLVADDPVDRRQEPSRFQRFQERKPSVRAGSVTCKLPLPPREHASRVFSTCCIPLLLIKASI